MIQKVTGFDVKAGKSNGGWKYDGYDSIDCQDFDQKIVILWRLVWFNDEIGLRRTLHGEPFFTYHDGIGDCCI